MTGARDTIHLKKPCKASNALLEVQNVSKSFGNLHVLKNISFSVASGERLVILGANGAGKTTLLQLISGALQPSSGDIVLQGRSIVTQSINQRAQNGIAQSYQKNTLFETLSVGENFALAIIARYNSTGTRNRSLWEDGLHNQAVRDQVQKIATTVCLLNQLDKVVKHIPYGNRRQLELGLALATQPRLLLLDEPTSGVGPEMIAQFHQLLDTISRNVTLIIIEHDLDLAFDLADQVIVLNDGQLILADSPKEARENSLVQTMYLGSKKC